MKKIYEIEDIDLVRKDLIGCLDVNIHGTISGKKTKVVSRIPKHLREKTVDSLFAYMSVYELPKAKMITEFKEHIEILEDNPQDPKHQA